MDKINNRPYKNVKEALDEKKTNRFGDVFNNFFN